MKGALAFRLYMLPARQIDKALPKKGLIYEVGSGLGVLGAYLARQHPTRKVVGLEIDSKKVTKADAEFVGPNLSFVLADALGYSYKECQGIVLSDLLHHLSFAGQKKLLHKLYQTLSPGGVLTIKEADDSATLRKWLHRLWDFLLYPHDQIFYRSRAAWTELLTDLGFSVTSEEAVLWFPGSTIIYTCIKE